MVDVLENVNFSSETVEIGYLGFQNGLDGAVFARRSRFAASDDTKGALADDFFEFVSIVLLLLSCNKKEGE
jgi:hypothetical protein